MLTKKWNGKGEIERHTVSLHREMPLHVLGQTGAWGLWRHLALVGFNINGVVEAFHDALAFCFCQFHTVLEISAHHFFCRVVPFLLVGKNYSAGLLPYSSASSAHSVVHVLQHIP